MIPLRMVLWKRDLEGPRGASPSDHPRDRGDCVRSPRRRGRITIVAVLSDTLSAWTPMHAATPTAYRFAQGDVVIDTACFATSKASNAQAIT